MVSKVCMFPVIGKFRIYCYFFEGIIWLRPHIFIPCLFLLECRAAFGALLLWVCVWPLCRWVHQCFDVLDFDDLDLVQTPRGFYPFLSLLQRGGGEGGTLTSLGHLAFPPLLLQNLPYHFHISQGIFILNSALKVFRSLLVSFDIAWE